MVVSSELWVKCSFGMFVTKNDLCRMFGVYLDGKWVKKVNRDIMYTKSKCLYLYVTTRLFNHYQVRKIFS